MKMPVLAFVGSLLLFAGTIAENIWWSTSHNFINVSCTNFVYHSRHLQPCATWNLGNGIQSGVCIPLILIGAAGLICSATWFAIRRWGDL